MADIVYYMEKKLKIDPKKVEYDGRSFRLIIEDESSLIQKLKEKQSEIIKDISESDSADEFNSNDQAARENNEINP
jgi:hypothetical protein